MGLEVIQDFIAGQYADRARTEKKADAMSNKARLRTLPGYLRVADRPKCRRCGKPQPLDVYSRGRCRYGYAGHGIFCSLTCGYYYGLTAAGGSTG